MEVFVANWHNLTIEETLRQLSSNRHGLTDEEARHRLKKYGRNELLEKEGIPWPIVLLRQFASPLIYILLTAAAIELFYMGKPTDAGVIFFSSNSQRSYWFLSRAKSRKAIGGFKSA